MLLIILVATTMILITLRVVFEILLSTENEIKKYEN